MWEQGFCVGGGRISSSIGAVERLGALDLSQMQQTWIPVLTDRVDHKD